MGSFVRRGKTASGAIAVQIVHKRGRRVVGIEHVGSAHDEGQLALLLEAARVRLNAGQQELPLESASGAGRPAGAPVVTGTASLLVWEALASVYSFLGFERVGDDAFRSLVLGRIIEPTSKVDTLRVLAELGVPVPSRSTVTRCVKRVTERDYRARIVDACYAHATRTGALALVLYDLTTLHFETDQEDSLRKVGMSKERRVDPQVTVGLLTDATGFPLDVHLFEGNKAETKTLIPVLSAFRARHGAEDIVVVADAGMLSAANLLALEDAGFEFIVGSRISKAPYDLAEQFETRGNHFADGQTIETTRTMGRGADKRDRRVVYQWSFKRYQHDNRAINKMVERAEKVADGSRPLKKDRFVKFTDTATVVDWSLVERARYLAGLKGFVTNIPEATMTGAQVIAAYHDLYQVERSFRMAKSDLAARPMYHRARPSIEAHLTIVFAALAVSREAQTRTGLSIKKILQILRPLRSATIALNGQEVTAPPLIPDDAQQVIDDLARGGH
ncbi:IS1634 family transposase [Intrasporangium calvum]|uniref:IS1634 family transposase n=1 Tax=Intrasporangium calvum TaxID=53358 RepID=A0ABT5GII1_9MICO|nr:IS1634 family transposase [Intrasporangium calvum]MDC5698060.1 IS1634 family transposase [Intrasporangium calvum]